MRKLVILVPSVLLLVAACGDNGGGSGSGGGQPVSLAGNTANKGTKDISGTSVDLELADFAFTPTFLKGGTPGATITVNLKNTGRFPHTFTSSALGQDIQVANGATETVQITLPQSGATEFHCRFHQASNGMQGAFFFKDGDTVNATGGAGAGSSSSSDPANPYGPN